MEVTGPAAPKLRPTGVLRFGVFEVDPHLGELRKNGLKVKLTGQPFQVLAMLLERPGEVVAREDLQKRLWPADTFVDFDHSLNTAINKIREALGDSAESPRFVETVPRRGYRFIAPVESIGLAGVEPSLPPAQEVPLGQPGRAGEATEPPLRKRWPLATAGAAIVVAAVLAYLLTRPLPPPRVLSSTQITNDGRAKVPPILTDGSRLYFMVQSGTIRIPYQVSIAGGEPAVLSALGAASTAFASSLSSLAGISADGSELLVQSYEGTLHGGSLWVIPTVSGSAHRISGLTSSDAAWSPDGQMIVYARADKLNVARRDGSGARELAAVSGAASWIRWSPDGRLLRFTVTDPQMNSSSLWEVAADGTKLHPLLAGWHNPPSECCGNWTRDGSYFVFQFTHLNRSDIWAFREKAGLFRKPKPQPVQLTSGPLNFLGPTPGNDSKKLFVAGAQPRGELVRYDRRSQQFVPYLGGISADTVDFSRDGEWVTYVADPEGTLWRSKADGTERLQLTFPSMVTYLPRWSPDGKQIAFHGILPGKPWTMYIVSAEGGDLREIKPWLGDIGWSPDGSALVFTSGSPVQLGPSHMPTYRKNQEVIQTLDLKSNQVSTLPDSEGLYSPRWSPDGRFIAALRAGPETLWVFDLSRRRWSELGKIGAGFPSWSHDSKYVYFDSLEGFYRFRIADRKLEQIASLKGIKRTGVIFPWSGLAPDDSPLVLRDIGTQEIYALDWDAP